MAPWPASRARQAVSERSSIPHSIAGPKLYSTLRWFGSSWKRARSRRVARQRSDGRLPAGQLHTPRAEGVGIQCKEGLLTRLERMMILIVGLLIGQTVWALAVIAILAGFTAVQRIWITWQAARVAV